MQTKRVELERIEVLSNGIVQLKFTKIVEEDGVVLSAEPHRAALYPGQDVDTLATAVDNHLVSMGYPKARAGAWSQVKARALLTWTPAKIAEFLALPRRVPLN